MSASVILWVFFCVLAISSGQLFFKMAGLEIQATGSWHGGRALIFLGIAGFIYMGATLLWIQLLRQVPLSRAYVFMALSFVIVPLASHYLFHEPLHSRYWIGLIVIIVGILVVASAPTPVV